MRYCLILEKDKCLAIAIQKALDGIEDFGCADVIGSVNGSFRNLSKFSPELVIINLDNFYPNSFKMIQKVNKNLGLKPKYIGITSSYERGFEAFKKGFLDVINPSVCTHSLQSAQQKYRDSIPKPKILCLQSSRDFKYVHLKKLIWLKADNNTTDLFLKSGEKLSSLKTLKYFSTQLPLNFQRVHRSYIINSEDVKRINFPKKEIHLAHSQFRIPFSKNYSTNVEQLKELIVQC